MLYTLLAILCIALALLGLVIPGLPTTPFLLLAAWAANRGSPRLHRWLIHHRHLGPPLRDWEQQRAVRPRAKLLAVTLLAASWGLMLWRGIAPAVLVPLTLAFVAVAAFVVTRPSPK